MKKHEIFLDELRACVAEAYPRKLFNYIEENAVCFFSSPYISDYYGLLKDTDFSASDTMLPRLIKAWLAFLCGDNAGLNSVTKHINETGLESSYEKSFYFALKSLSGLSTSYEDKLKNAKLSIEVLPADDRSLYMANARLTYAQILAGLDQYRSAIDLFDAAYCIFYDMDMLFPAVVALTNKLLNKYKLGEFNEVIDEANNALVMSASFRNDTHRSSAQLYWNILHLPLGMCYFELNKPSLAISHLKPAKSCIDSMNLLHMHGLIELYLFKSYFALKDKEGMEEVKCQAHKDLGHMHYNMTELLLCMFRVMSMNTLDEKDISNKLQPDIEWLELGYMRYKEKSPFLLIELLAYLKIKGLSDAVTADALANSLEKLRFTGIVPNIQHFLILLAEIHFMNNELKYAAELLKEAVEIFREHGICINFYMLPLKSLQLIQKIDRKLYDNIAERNSLSSSAAIPDNSNSQILSARETEIIRLIAAGKSNDEISKALFISIGTTKWHINHIFSKLEAANRVQAIQKAKSLGVIT